MLDRKNVEWLEPGPRRTISLLRVKELADNEVTSSTQKMISDS